MLVTPRTGQPDLLVGHALDRIAQLGYELVGVIDPADYRVAHQMVADGRAEVIVVTRLGDLPSVRSAGMGGTAQNQRSQPVLRPAAEAAPEQPGAGRARRTQLIRRTG